MVAEVEAQKYVRSIANRFARRNNADAEELFQVGYVGLLKAKKTFDPSRGVPFLPYSQYRIAAEIKEHLRSFVRRPHGLGYRNGNRPVEVFSYDESETGEGSMFARVNDVMAMADKTTPEGLCDVAQTEDELRLRVECLPARLREIVRKIFWEGETLRTIGAHMGLSAEWIRQLENKALQMIGEENMTLSRNVKQETMQALRSSTSQTEAAGKLGISQSALSYRIKHDPDLMELAVSKGFVREKAPEAATRAKEILTGAASAQPEDRENQVETQTGAPVIEHDRVFEKPEPLIAFKGAVLFFGEKLWVDVRVERR